jgi:hypothetical protein
MGNGPALRAGAAGARRQRRLVAGLFLGSFCQGAAEHHMAVANLDIGGLGRLRKPGATSDGGE